MGLRKILHSIAKRTPKLGSALREEEARVATRQKRLDRSLIRAAHRRRRR